MALLSIIGLAGCEKMEISDDLAGYDPNNELVNFVLELTGPGQTSGQRVIDIGSAAKYTQADATEKPQEADFIMLWGATSDMNLVSPLDINRLRQWGSGKTVNETWLVKNATTIMKFGAADAALYDDVKELEDVKKAYDEALTKVKDQEGYDVLKNGPAISIRGMQEGDILFFKTQKNVYAVAKVLSLSTGTGGKAKFAFKVDKREEEAIAPISEEERLDTYDVGLEYPAYYNHYRFLDVVTGKPYSNSNTLSPADEHAFYHQEKVDFIFLNSSNSGANLITIADADRLNGWATGKAINSDWLVKNEGTFLKLSASDAADSLFLNSYTKTKLHEAYEAAKVLVTKEEGYDENISGPGTHIASVQEGDLIFFESTSKNVLAMFQVTNYTSGGSGALDLSARVDNSGKVDVAPSPQALNHGLLKVGGWSALGPEGNTIHVDLATITRFDPASAAASQGSIDLLNLWSAVNNANFMAPSASGVTGWGTSSPIVDWNIRNEGTFIKVDAPTAEEVETFEGLVNRDLLVAAYDAAATAAPGRPGYTESYNGPGDRVRDLQEGDIIYFKSNMPGRNLYAAIEIRSIVKGTSNGREVVEIFVKSNLLNE